MSITVYIVYHKASDSYYSSGGSWHSVPLEDAKIFSKKNTASGCSNRWKGSVVIPCTLTIPDLEAPQ